MADVVQDVLDDLDPLLERMRDMRRHRVTLFGREYVVHADVFSPAVLPGPEIARGLPFPKGGRLLEVGAGCGIISLEALLWGGCNQVVAVDINPNAVKNTEENARRFNVADRIRCLVSDVYSALDESERFDMIFWNYPFAMTPRKLDEMSMLQKACADPQYQHLDKYCRDARRFLAPGGRLWIAFSPDLGDTNLFHRVARRHGWEPQRHDVDAPNVVLDPSSLPDISIPLWELVDTR